jgi:hypothetical protein
LQCGNTFLYETNSSLFYLLIFSLSEIKGQSRRHKSSVLLALDVGNGLNYPSITQFKNDQNTNIITSNPATLVDMGVEFVSKRISNNDGRMRGGVRCSMTMPKMALVEEWMGQEGVEPQDRANSIDLISGFFDPGGRFAFTNGSVHYHHWLGFCLSDGYSCHSRVEQVSLQENILKSVPPFSGVVLSWVHVFPSQAQHSPVLHKLCPLLIWRSPFVKSTSSLS